MNDLMFAPIVKKILLVNMIGRDIWNFMTLTRYLNVLAFWRMDENGVVTKNLNEKMR
jgi:hypothetical protein